MIIVKGEVRFAAGRIAGLRGALRKNVEATRAEQGCLGYAYAVDVLDPDLLHVAEQWESEAAIDAHMGAPHMAELMEALGDAVAAISVKAYEARYARTLLGE